jgi:DNA topoisomerase-1
MKLIIVESPTKAKTISKFLEKEFKIESSYGHIRDLPKGKMGIDIQNDFEPQYVIPRKARKRVTALKKISQKAEEIILATDADREGEAIAWHLALVLQIEEKSKRIVFHEITKKAIEEALKNPRQINLNLVNAQQARRILDRLVGYELSPFLWKKLFKGLSAGRVQSVALRLIVEREEEIQKFKPEKYWTIEAIFLKDNQQFKAYLCKINGKTIPAPGIKNEEEVEEILKKLKSKNARFEVTSFKEGEYKKSPPPPFITSTLQGEANRKLRFTAKQTMSLAQSLYEKGFITYMRTDSLNLSQESLEEAFKVIEKKYGKNYLPEKFRIFKNKSKLAQEAHEAIRPTNPHLDPQKINLENANEKKLYDLIWRRFIASQMKEAVFSTQSAEITSQEYTFKSNGLTIKFDGFLKVWPQSVEEKLIPFLDIGEEVNLSEIKKEEHSTEPPPRFNEATLIKTLENYGIGRPSTYATIISVIQERNYVTKNKDKRFVPTETGKMVNDILVKNFPEIVDINFTAKMEEELDEVALGKRNWKDLIKEFYIPFSLNLKEKYETIKPHKINEETEEKCEKCGRKMVIKISKFGKFLACSGFPECKNTKPLKKEEEDLGYCPECKEGKIVIKRTKNKRIFYGCSNYPNCKWASWTNPKLTSEKNNDEVKNEDEN